MLGSVSYACLLFALFDLVVLGKNSYGIFSCGHGKSHMTVPSTGRTSSEAERREKSGEIAHRDHRQPAANDVGCHRIWIIELTPLQDTFE